MHGRQITCLILLLTVAGAAAQTHEGASYDYSGVLASTRSAGIAFSDLPGFTRSVYERDHALVTPESRVFQGVGGWTNAETAYIISPAVGANFAMYIATMRANASAPQPPQGIERFVFVLDGLLTAAEGAAGSARLLHAGDFAYIPPDSAVRLTSSSGAGFLVYERRYCLKEGKPAFKTGATDEQATLPVAGEVFLLRKLLPQTADYDFNVHVMDFLPGEFLNVKEVHYNQHGLLLLQGQGIYRLADKWYPVQAGDAIWMAPYVVQWYGALGTQNSRYIIYKDTTTDPVQV